MMVAISYGDLASSLAGARLSSQIKQNLDTYAYEISSGVTEDVSAAVSGDFTPLASIERSIRSLSAYETSQNEAALFATTLQVSLSAVSEHMSGLSLDLIMAAQSGTDTNVALTSNEANMAFEAVISSLNTSIGGRSLLSGAATGTTPLASASDILSEIITVASAESSAQDAIDAVENWFFEDGGGFETLGYLGSENDLAPLTLSEGETADIDLKADDAEIRELLKGLAIASLVNGGLFNGQTDQQKILLQQAGESLLSSEADLINLQSTLGSIEEKISNSQTARSAEEYALEIAKTDIIGIDTYEVATKLTQAESQLEMMYTITARLSNLHLSDYI
jgi:flagellar hook-associated protein 3 FlgL